MNWTVCNEPGCPTLVELDAKCPDCRSKSRRASDAKRPNSTQRGYGRHWREQVREPFLRYFPVCVDCGGRSEVPDHDPISRAELVRRGVPNPDDFGFLVPRCVRCHNQRTATEEAGFGVKPRTTDAQMGEEA